MQIDKSAIIDFLRSQGNDDKAAAAEGELPQQVDTDRDQNILDRLGVDIPTLLAKVADSGQLGGVAGKLGGMFK